MFGEGHVFDDYKSGWESWDDFYERSVIKGEKIRTGWVNATDIDPKM